MLAERVVAPDGREWVVRRRWLPRLGGETLWGRFHRRFRQTVRRAGDVADADPGCLEVVGEGIVAAIAIIVFVLVLIFVAVPLLVAIVDIVILLLLALLGVLARVVLRRPWLVEARANDGTALEWKVVGWRASGEWRREMAELLQAGVSLPPRQPTPP